VLFRTASSLSYADSLKGNSDATPTGVVGITVLIISVKGECFMKLIQNSSTPLYRQIEENIRVSIENGLLNFGDKIEAEPEIMQRFNVSRITVRQAISNLVNEGYLIKKQGKGTFVNKPKIKRKIDHLLSFTEACNTNGMKASSEVIKKEIIIPSKEEKDFLQLDDEDKVIYIQRIRLADDDPIMYENNYFSYSRFKFLLDEQLNGSLYKLLREKYNVIPINPMRDSLEVVRANNDVAKILKVPAGEPLFYMKTFMCDSNNNPVHIGKQFILGKRYKFDI
jgi:GntR family transcriptional regulator